MGLPIVAPVGLKQTEVGQFDPVQRQLTLRKLLDEQKTRQQEQQINDLAIQKGQAEQADAQASQKAWKIANGDPDKYVQIAPQMGVSADKLLKDKKGIEDYFKSVLDRSKAQHDLEGDTQNAIGNTIAGIARLPEEARAAAMPGAVNKLIQDKWLTPEQAQPYMQYQGDDWLQSIGEQVGAAKKLHQIATDKRDEATFKAKEAAGTLAGPLKEPAPVIQEYNIYAKQQKDAGKTPLGIDEYIDARAKAKAAATPEGTLTFGENAQGKTVLFNNKTGAIQAPEGIQKPGTKKAQQDYVIGINEKNQQVMVPEGEADKYNLTQTGKAPTAQVASAMDARQFKTIADKQGDPKKPETMGIKQLIDSLDKDGKLGVASSRMNDFLFGRVGTLPGDDPRIAALLNKADLAMTLSMKAHFGTSGGRSPAMLAHFLNMANAKKMDGPALKAGFNAVDDYMTDRAMLPSDQSAAAPSASSFTIKLPSGKTVTIGGQ